MLDAAAALVRVAAGQSSLTTTSSRVPVAVGGRRPRRSSRGRPAGAAKRRRRARVAAVLEQGAHEPALGRLVEVADHLPPAVTSCSTRTVDHPRREVGGRAARTRRTSTSAGRRRARAPARSRDAPGRARSRQCAGDAAEPGQGDVAGEPVRRDPVARADQPEERRHDREPGQRPGDAADASSVGEVERVVQHAGVDPFGRAPWGSSRSRALRRTSSAWVGAETERPRRRRPGRPSHRRDQRVEHLARGRRRARARPGRRGRRGLPRRGAALPSLGGSRISTRKH